MTSHTPSQSVKKAIDRVRSALRAWSLGDGIALVVMGIATLFWVSLAVDYFAEPSLSVRYVMLAVLGATVAFWIGRFVVSRLRAPISNPSVALLIERAFPELRDRLVTAVELEKADTGFSPAMLRATIEEAEREIEHLPIGDVLRRKHVIRRLVGAGFLVLTVGLAFVWLPTVTSTWFERVVQLANVRYPRRTHVRVLGFDGPVKKVARGRDYELLAEADANRSIPDKMQVRYWMGKASSENYLTQIGINRFRFGFNNLLDPVDFEVRGGDDRTELYRLEVVEPPALTEIGIKARFPEYTGLPPHELVYRGAPIAFVKGTKLTLSMDANKSVDAFSVAQGKRPLAVVRLRDDAFQTELDLGNNDPIVVTITDKDGIDADPFSIHVTALDDQPPVADAMLEGIGRAITPMARIPFRARVSDDFGVKTASFRLAVDGGERPEQPIPLEGQDPLAIEGLFTIDAERLDLKPGGKLAVTVTAKDANPAANSDPSRSAEFVFEIITPEELLSRISTRELNLRQQFEQLMRELRETHDRMQNFAGQIAKEMPSDRSVPRLQAERAVQEFRKNTNETNGIFQSYRGILDELKNNRAGTTTLHDRLDQGILRPLEGLLGHEVVDADNRLQELRAALEGSHADECASRAEAARASLQLVLFRADEILKSMLKLESFNEAVALLRAIIADQNQLLEKTRSERKKQVLDLLK